MWSVDHIFERNVYSLNYTYEHIQDGQKAIFSMCVGEWLNVSVVMLQCMCLTLIAINGTHPNLLLPLPRTITTILHHTGFLFPNRDEVDITILVFSDN